MCLRGAHHRAGQSWAELDGPVFKHTDASATKTTLACTGLSCPIAGQPAGTTTVKAYVNGVASNPFTITWSEWSSAGRGACLCPAQRFACPEAASSQPPAGRCVNP